MNAYRRGFTLVELLIVMTILAILAGLTVVGLAAAVNDARASRTRTIIDKIDILVMERWEGYRTKSVRVNTPRGATAQQAAFLRLASMRELQRCELPERISDLCDMAELADLNADGKLDAVNNYNGCVLASLTTLPSLTRSYKRLAERSIEGTPPRAWSTEFQGSECLYLILSTMKDHDKSALDYFSTDEIGDVDGDGMKEILDGWGRPLEFLRWTPGYTTDNLAMTDQKADVTRPDPFDPLKVDGSDTYEIRPLIYSAGPDGSYEVNRGQIVYALPRYPSPTPPGELPNDPYFAASPLIGTPFDTDSDLVEGWNDNISNHYRPE